MTRTRHPRLARRGFTLVELMVATALVVLILTILAVAFAAATDSLSRLRSMGNMATDLRGAQDKLRADVEAEHFQSGVDGSPDSPGVLKLGDLRYDELGTVNGVAVRPPTGGYFRISSGNGSVYEGADADGLSSTRATTHSIEFTAKRQGTTADDLYVVPVSAANVGLLNQNATDTPLTGGQFVSKWAQIRWYLDNPQNVGGVQVWTLYRCVRAITPTSTPLAGDELDQIAHRNNVNSSTLVGLATPGNRGTVVRYQPGTTYFGDDIALSNVTSFEVKPVWQAAAGTRNPRAGWPATLGNLIPDGNGAIPNGDLPFDDLPAVADNPSLAGQRLFDTWSGNQTGWNTAGGNTSLPLRIRVTALQIKLRVYDPKNLLSRQVSFIVQP